jgi:hypothetical protein
MLVIITIHTPSRHSNKIDRLGFRFSPAGASRASRSRVASVARVALAHFEFERT